jgi:tetratricopeptide (TPR) repeat protein
LQHYNAGRFPDAVIAFSTVADRNPYDQAAHYYLANSLAYLKDYQGAFDEYQMCYQLDPNGTYAAYSKVGMQRFASAARDQENDGSGPFAAGSEPPDFIFDGPTQELIVLQKTLSLMNHQTMAERNRIRLGASTSAASRRRYHRALAARIREDAEERFAWPGDPHERDEMFNAVMAMLRYQNHLERMHERQSMRESIERSAAIETTATNLASQFYAKRSRSGVALQPAGTNLYVRNYEHFELPALKARAERLQLPPRKKLGI